MELDFRLENNALMFYCLIILWFLTGTDWDYKYQLMCQMLLSSAPLALIRPLLKLSVQTSQ